MDARTSTRSREEPTELRVTRTSPLAAVFIAVALVSCSSSGSTAKEPASTSSAAPTTTASLPGASTTTSGDPDLVPNQIPFNVGELAARSNDWRMEVTKVTRPLPPSGLPSLADGQQYVGVDIMLINGGNASVNIDARKIFSMVDEKGRGRSVVSGAKGATGFDAPLASGATLNGHLVFAVPVGQDLLMGLDGPEIHTQRTVFQIDPPTHPAVD